MSIIIPNYNYERYVLDAILSCVSQDYENKEIIVVDDCSTDNSWHAVERAARMWPGVKTLRNKFNRGYSFAKNAGIRISTGDLIVTLDADDMLTPDSIKIRADFMAKYPVYDMVHGRAYIIKDDGGYEYHTKRMYKLPVHKGRKIHAQTTMIRRDVHLKYGLYDESLRSRSDNEMWYRLIMLGKIREEKLKTQLAFYRRHDRSMVAYRKKNPLYNLDVTKRLEDVKIMRMRFGITPDNTPWLKK